MSRFVSGRTNTLLGGLATFGVVVYAVSTSRLADPVGDELVSSRIEALGRITTARA